MAVHWRKIELKLLHPQFLQDIERLLGESQYEWYITEGYRSIERSNELYAAYKAGTGPRAAPGGKSAHNFGLAVDVALDSDLRTPGLQPSWDSRMDGWLWLRGAVNAHPRLRGGWWFNDWPHIERYKWELHKNWRDW